MKGAIANAVTTFAQAAGSWSDRDTVTIERLRRELHAANNELAAADGALRILALHLGLSEDTPPAQIVDAAIARTR